MVNATSAFPRTDFPPESVLKCHPLLIVDFEKIKAGDAKEIDTLFHACSTLGFFYLKGFNIDPEPMFGMGEDTFALPLEELMPFEQGDSGMSAGYKAAGANNVDSKGNLDTIQFINVAKDDALAYPEVRHRTYPHTVVDKMAIVTKFVRDSDNVLQTLLASLEPRLGLPAGTLAALHKEGDISGSESRCIYKPAQGEKGYVAEGVGDNGDPASAIGAHTDFGSFSMLHGRGCGGLEVLPPGTKEWQPIRPLAGHAVCNVGDTLSVYSGNILKSNIHRVVPPPPPQNAFTRWSLVYFLRPGFSQHLYPLIDDSTKIKAAMESDPVMKSFEKGKTAGEWYKRRIAKQRVKNRKGPETWGESRGTEHTPTAT